MKRVLYVVGNNLQVNNSANLSHNAYVNGLVENGYEVDVVMSEHGYLSVDNGIELNPNAHYIAFPTTSRLNEVAERTKQTIDQGSRVKSQSRNVSVANAGGLKKLVRSVLKKGYYFIKRRQEGVYVNGITWIKNASTFSPDKEYDLIISNSSPASSHKVVSNLRKKNSIIRSISWIQIWEDPWCYDLYGKKSGKVEREEAELLREADFVFYVSPLTLYYQKQYYPKSAKKMGCIPLPYYQVDEVTMDDGYQFEIGYFGDYHDYVRNLLPCYKTAVEHNIKAVICGSSNNEYESKDSVLVKPRINLDELARLQSQTHIFICLSNLRGGQIPGKIYHYSATKHPILFILDGTEVEQKMIREYFSQYDRYYFCANNEKDIYRTLQMIRQENRDFAPVDDYSPKHVIERMMINIGK